MTKRCIVCGKELEVLYPDDGNNNRLIKDGLTEIISASYGSKFDGVMLEITICDDCIQEKIDNKII
jgi:hypothetical protein